MFLLRLLWNRHTRQVVLWVLRYLYGVRRGRVMCVSWNGAHYNCNPRAIAEALVADNVTRSRFEVHYAFQQPQAHPEVPSAIHRVEIGSLDYFHLLATSQFIISNVRFAGQMFPYKKRRQYYIQTMHGGHGLKRVEMDVDLPEAYQRSLLADARRTDLMLSDSRFWTHLAHTAFRFSGEVMEQGLPRNDVFFAPDAVLRQVRRRVLAYAGIAEADDVRLLVYTPTFRSNGRRDVYGFDAPTVLAALSRRFGGQWYALVSSHPNMRSYYRDIYDFSNPMLRDVGAYPDLQDILVAGDVCLTDYSSAGMEFCLTGKPVFLLARDLSDYDRGFYFDPHTLPWPLAETDDELVRNIERFDAESYREALDRFNREQVGLSETGHATRSVIRWMMDRYW